ncbi:MAG: MATE family efflux transporter [Pseudomonadota bacterium]
MQSVKVTPAGKAPDGPQPGRPDADQRAAFEPSQTATFAARLVAHWSDLLRLAWPVMLSRAGIFTLSLADIVMIGRYATGPLAETGLALSIFVPIMVTGVGAMVGIVALSARAIGAGDRDEAAKVWRRGIAWALVIGLLCSALSLLAGPFLHLIEQPAPLADAAGRLARILAPGALFQILFIACSFYLEATRRMLPGLICMALANLVNIAGNWLLISGNLGFPALGAEGAALAVVLARLIMAGAILAYILRLPEIRALPVSGFWGPGGWRAAGGIRTLGLASALALFFETGAFAAVNLFAGYISADALAAYAIAHQVEGTVFMIALGLSVAAAVRVGHAYGAGRIAEARFAGWSALAVTMLAVALMSSGVVWGAGRLGGLFSEDPAMIARTAPLFVILAVSLIFDGGQVVIGQANRAMGDSWASTACFFVSFWLVMVPLAYALALMTPLREAGLFLATAAGCIVALILLSWRFHSLLARAERGNPDRQHRPPDHAARSA